MTESEGSSPVSRITDAITLVNSYARNPGSRRVAFDPGRIIEVVEITSMLHPEVRAFCRRAYEVRFDDRYHLTSLVVVGPEGLMNHLQDVRERQQPGGAPPRDLAEGE